MAIFKYAFACKKPLFGVERETARPPTLSTIAILTPSATEELCH